MKSVPLDSTESVPALGIGTWRMGEARSMRAEEIATLQLALELGIKVIDTAEMYGSGSAEELIGDAICGIRDQAFIVSKVYPHNASRAGAVAACERSLRRLKTDRIDLYLLHWRGQIPLPETMQAFVDLKRSGKIRHYGVSNFDRPDMEELWSTDGGHFVVTNQVLYNLVRRGIELDLLPWLDSHSVSAMAYSPIEQARLLDRRELMQFAKQHNTTPAKTALGWLLAKNNVIVIPKTSHRDRLRENYAAATHPLTQSQVAELDRMFPRPKAAGPLEML